MYSKITSSLRRWRIALTAILLPLVLAGCGSSSSSTPPAKVTLSGAVTFPSGSAVSKTVAKTAAATTTPPTVEIRRLDGTLVTTVQATGTGPFNYTVPDIDQDDYLIKAVSASQVLKALVDKLSLQTTTTRNIDAISSTAVILAEKKIGVPPGTIGEKSDSNVTTSAIANIQPIILESTVASAVNAVLFAPSTATQANIDVANLANVVTASVYAGVDPAKFMAGTTTTPLATTQYTLVSGTATASTSAPVTTTAAQSTLTSATTSYTPPPANSVSFTSKVTEATTAGTPISGVSVTSVGLTPAIVTTTDANGLYVLAGIPQDTSFSVKMSKSGFADTSSRTITLKANKDVSASPYALFLPTTLTSWGNTAGNGVIRSRVVDSANLVTGYIGGAVVTATDQAGGVTYPVKYIDSFTGKISATLTSTDPANGFYVVLNVPAGHTVDVTASKTGYTFDSATFVTHADAVSQGRITGTGSSTSTSAPAFSQSDLAGTWKYIHFYTGPDVASGKLPGWAVGTSTIAGNGDVTVNSLTIGNTSISPNPISVPDPAAAVGGTINASIDATGKITETGTGSFATATTPAPLQMSSNKQITVGVASQGSNRILRINVKQVGTFSAADITGPGSFVESMFFSGTALGWQFSQGTIDSSSTITYTSKVASYGPQAAGPGGTLQITATGDVSNTVSSSYRGIMTPDKSLTFGVASNPAAVNQYALLVASPRGQTFTQADLAGSLSGVSIANETPYYWQFFSGSISSTGLYSETFSIDSNGSAKTGGGETFLVDSAGLLTTAADSSAHGFLSYDKKLGVVTSTWSPGVFELSLFVR